MVWRILVIEDNPTNLKLMVYLLKRFGYETCEATDGRTGLEMVGEQRPDLILCDLEMPVTDGWAVARALKADPVSRSTPLIAVTALAMVGDRERVLREGFDGYISKPIDPERFVSQVEAYLPGGAGRSAETAAPTRERSLAEVRKEGEVSFEARGFGLDEELLRKVLASTPGATVSALEVSRMLSLLRHELLNSLNTIIGFSDLLLDPAAGPLNAKQESFVRHIKEAGLAQLEVLNHLKKNPASQGDETAPPFPSGQKHTL